MNDLKNGRKKAEKFSEKTLEDFPMEYNESVRKITRNSFSTFITDNRKRDSAVLFYNSKEPGKKELLAKYLELVQPLYQIKENQNNIAFGYFDMGLNSHHVFRVKNEHLFLRLYKYSNLHNPVDKEFKEES